MTSDPIRLGALGLGRGFALSARGLAAHEGIDLVAASTRSETSRRAFEAAFGGRAYDRLEDMLAHPELEMVYVATPHGLHREHVCKALDAGKHVVVEKPMAVRLVDAEAMVAAADAAQRQLLVGPSHSYDPPVALAAKLIASGRLGRPRMLHGLYATDFIYRPRRPEELRIQDGGGVLFSQAVHQIDVAMQLLGPPEHVFAVTGDWDAERPSEGAYSAIITFANGATATLTYSGYGHLDGDTLMGGVSELGVEKTIDTTGAARRSLAGVADEAAEKKNRAFMGLQDLPAPTHHEHFGQVIVFCERGDIRLTPDGVVLSTAEGQADIRAPFSASRQGFAQALVDALRDRPAPVQTGVWGLTALRCCHGILHSARTGQTVTLKEVTDV